MVLRAVTQTQQQSECYNPDPMLADGRCSSIVNRQFGQKGSKFGEISFIPATHTSALYAQFPQIHKLAVISNTS